MRQTADVLLPLALKEPFTYAFQDSEILSLTVGSIVYVPFRSREMWGIVLGTSNHYSAIESARELKNIQKKSDLPPFSPAFLKFLKRVADYNYFPLGLSLKLTLNQDFLSYKKPRKLINLSIPNFSHHTPIFSIEQQYAITQITSSIQEQKFQAIVLDGITGSGKTEVYLEAIQQALILGKQVLVLLPEISLTSQLLDRFERRFGTAPLFWHSNVSPALKRQIWHAVLKGEAKVIVGARSALFLPFQKLGLIIIDEEHDGSYKQGDQITYHARDMAVLRANIENAVILLVSATPSLETIYNIENGRYQKIALSSRHGFAVLPKIQTIDMRQQPNGWLSPPLLRAIKDTIAVHQQVIIFLNRRGYAPLTLCRQCGGKKKKKKKKKK